MSQLRVAVALLVLLLIPGCGPKAVHGTWRVGALDSTLESVSRQGGILTVVISVTNSSNTSQPIALRRIATGSRESSRVILNEPWITAAFDVEPTGTLFAASGEPAGVTGGPPTTAPEMLAPHANIEIRQAYVDPGPGGATLAWAPTGVPGANFMTTARWRLP